jgi:hypothetical protein
MLKTGWFIVVLNNATILAHVRTVEDAEAAAEEHSTGCPRGRYAIYELQAPVQQGMMGDNIKWDR